MCGTGKSGEGDWSEEAIPPPAATGGRTRPLLSPSAGRKGTKAQGREGRRHPPAFPALFAGRYGVIFLFLLFMTKTDLVDAIVKSAGITKKAAGAALEALLDAITKDLNKGTA